MNYILDWLKKAAGQLNKFQKNLGPKFKRCLTPSNLEDEEVTKMVDLYVALIIAGRRTLAQVPVRFRPEVEADLQALGILE